MAITKLDEVLEAIQKGKTNDEIRDEIDGRLSDRRLNVLREHPNVRGGESVSSESVKAEIECGIERIFEAAIEREAGDCDTSSVSCADSFPSRGSLDGTAESGAKSATESVVEQKTVGIRVATPHQSDVLNGEPKELSDAWAERQKPVMRLKQTGAEYKGLLGYYVDNRAVTFWADGKEIDGDQLDELVEEIKEVVRIHRHFAEKG